MRWLSVALPAGADAESSRVSVMSRNLYLGADLTPGVQATSLQGLVNAAGVILKQVDDNNFRVRAKGLAEEILKNRPDLVGLQEVALWRTEPCTENPLPPHATQVRYDFLELLLKQLNKGKNRYRTVISQPEFDFEVWANADGNESTAAPGCPMGSEINGRLTMRDVILARNGRVQTSNPKGAHLRHAAPGEAGRRRDQRHPGLDAGRRQGPGSGKFRFVNTHLEAFDNQPSNHANQGADVGNGAVREAQAKELFKAGGPAAGPLPVILVGDLNSDVKTEVKPGDGLAYRALLSAGFAERSTSHPLGCCLDATCSRPRGREGQRLRPPGRPRDDQRAEEDQARELVGHRPQAGQRLLGLRSRRAVQHPEPALSRCLTYPAVGSLAKTDRSRSRSPARCSPSSRASGGILSR